MWFRVILASVTAAVAVFFALFAWAYNGYQEDYGSRPLDTLPLAIPWSVATAVLIGLTTVAVISRVHRERLSWFALMLAAAMWVVLAVVLA